MLFLCIDVGTTCCKAQVFNEKGEILFYEIQECPLADIDGEQYADIMKIVHTSKSLIKKASAAGKINSVAVSSFGEAFVLLDKEDNILTYPMLYTDPRGKEQAEKLNEIFTEDYLYRMTGVVAHPMYSLPKLLWIKENSPHLYEKADKLLLICDYIGYLLTGQRVIDYGLAARTGAFDIRRMAFCEDLLNRAGAKPSLFSKPMPVGTVVGKVSKKAADELGLDEDCKLVLGSHDQVCATLGAGITKAGQAADGMGTVECITSVFDSIPDSLNFGLMGYPVVPYAIKGLYCTYILNFSSGSLVNWFRKEILHNYSGKEGGVFSYLESRLGEKPGDILLLPHFAGAATPYQDTRAKGAILNLTLNASDGDIYRAVLEGTSFEMRVNLDTVSDFGIEVKEAVATGGGSNSKAWLQIKSDITGISLYSLSSSEGGLCGLAMIQAVALGASKDYEDAKGVFVKYRERYLPDGGMKELYDKKYEKYKKIYKCLKEFN